MNPCPLRRGLFSARAGEWVRVLGLSAYFVGILHAPSAVAQLGLPQFFSPTPVGSGARAAGMGNAFVAIADDATAASWNPAGLVQLELPEISAVAAYNGIREEFTNREVNPDFPSGFESTHDDGNLHLNFLSVVYPAYFLNHNVVFSLSYQERLQFDRNFDIRFDTAAGNSVQRQRADVEQDGAFSVITPSAAVSITQRLSIGLSANLWRSSLLSDNDFTSEQFVESLIFEDGVLTNEFTRRVADEYEDFSGENFVIGLLWSPTSRWNIAVRYDTAFKGSMDFRRVRTETGTNVPGGFFQEIIDDERHLRLPATVAVGTSVRFNDRFTASVDATRTSWDHAYIETENDEKLSLVDGVNLDSAAATDFDTTYSVRIGGEYVLIPRHLREKLNYLWTLRGGLSYEEEPASGRPTAGPGILQPGDGDPDRFYGFALGAGLLVHQRINLDISYQLRYGNNVNSDYVRGVPGFSEDIVQHRVLLSAIVYLR